ncbi:hypothetical protein IGI04_023152 [Brassica rapa subsp. trilocularis]|uniref:Uncharacterized protein n=1 Tax=Brassica rapa subsp. trilocularis TaxID=1813537 RepID=A0ABQ7M327_BRACM|nr:hypothetical protein IGI04_023152 [Brassica rapa subsp. trilocularis]
MYLSYLQGGASTAIKSKMANSCFKRCHHMQDHLGIDLMIDELKRILRSEIEGSTGPVVNGDHHVNTMLVIERRLRWCWASETTALCTKT